MVGAVAVSVIEDVGLFTTAATFDGDSTTAPNGNGSLISNTYGSAFFRWMDFSPFSDGTEGGTCACVYMHDIDDVMRRDNLGEQTTLVDKQ